MGRIGVVVGGLGGHVWPGELPADAAAAGEALLAEDAAVRVAESRRIVLVAHWLDLHGPVEHPDTEGGGRVLPGTERYVPAGAAGTPLVAEFACAELGALLGMGPGGARALQAKVANLVHRHPVLYTRVCRGEVPGWKALETARLVGRTELGLSAAQAHWIDDRSHEWVTTLPWGAYCELLEQLIVQVDPAGAQHRADAAAARQGVWTTRSTEHGLKTMVARAAAGEISYLIAVVDRIAAILADRGDTRSLEARRAAGLTLLAHPAHALALLAEHAAAHAHDPHGPAADPDDTDNDDENDAAAENDGDAEADATDVRGDATGQPNAPKRADEGESDTDDENDASDEHAEPGSLLLFGDPDPEGLDAATPAGDESAGGVPAGGVPRRGQWSFLTVPGELAHALRLLARPGVLDRLLPTATVYVHLDQAATPTTTSTRGGHAPVNGPVIGPATVEGHGVITAEQARAWLGHRRVTLTPVIDLNAVHAPVQGYVFPRRLRQVMHLTNPRDTFPYGTTGAPGSRGKDADHITPYVHPDEHGPPAQTGLHNGTLLGRFAHRLKTHGRWRPLHLKPGHVLWHSPHGHSYLVDPLGTHPVPHAVLPWLLQATHHTQDQSAGDTGDTDDTGSTGDTGDTGDKRAA